VVALKALVRYFSYVFNGLLALFLLAVSGLALASGAANLHLGMLPWSGAMLKVSPPSVAGAANGNGPRSACVSVWPSSVQPVSE